MANAWRAAVRCVDFKGVVGHVFRGLPGGDQGRCIGLRTLTLWLQLKPLTPIQLQPRTLCPRLAWCRERALAVAHTAHGHSIAPGSNGFEGGIHTLEGRLCELAHQRRYMTQAVWMVLLQQ